MELEAPSPARYLVGAAIMMAGVVLPLAYMIFRSKRSPSSSSAASAAGPSFSKQDQGPHLISPHLIRWKEASR
ncbi:hypothetical protein ACP70R_013201 [Stipagrostis hirtigluma subsp. patula]